MFGRHLANGLSKAVIGRWIIAPRAASTFLFLIRIAFVGLLGASSWLSSASAEVTSTRVGTFDWQCQDVNGVRISDHTRVDTAFIACLNAPAGAFVQGGRYRLTKTIPVVPVPTPVPPAPTNIATLSWTAPTANTNGTPLTDLIGYKIVYGTSAAALNQSIAVGLVTSRVVADLTPGTWYFAVIAVSSTSESDRSTVVSKVIAL